VPNDSLDLRPVARDVARAPATLTLIFGTLIAAFCFNALPWSGLSLALRPDLLLVMLLFWSLHEPGRVGQGTAFIAGALMDVLDLSQLGQHALGYLVAIFLGQLWRVRVLKFRGVEQLFHVFGLLLIARLIELTLVFLLARNGLGLPSLLSPVIATLLWLPLTWVLFHPLVRTRRAKIST
jgi:rod shape-determining protein MreD